jgi:flagellar hook protein FlgE
MSLIRSLNSGVSGLRAFQTKMDVIGNNIANVETAGFKSSRVSFAEMMNQRLGRSGGGSDSSPQNSNQVGLGVRVSSIDRNFTQGALQTTGIGTDLAIEGEGFFVVNDGRQDLMTRAGNFVFNKDGFLVDQTGRFVQGFNADPSGNILAGGRTSDVRIDFENVLPPKQTETVKLAGNLNANTSSLQIIQALNSFTVGGALANLTTDINDLDQTTTDLVVGDVIEFEVTDNDGNPQTISYTYAANDTVEDMINSFNTQFGAEGRMTLVDGILVLRSEQLGDSELNVNSIQVNGTGAINTSGFQISQEGATNKQIMSTTIFDNLGRAHSLLIEFTQIGINEWEYTAKFLDGQVITNGENGTVEFDELGNLISNDLFSLTFEPGNGAGTTTFDISLGDSIQGTKFTQFAGTNSAKVVSQDGFQQGTLVDMNIDADGRVQGVFDNGKTQVLSQLALAQVQNQNGLELVDGGVFMATSAAGQVFVDTVQNMSGTSINSGTLEGSNVDLAREFTDMITAQRAYQSSARVISTSDEMLTEAVNLKR